MKILKKNCIYIHSNTKVVYCTKNNILTAIGNLNKHSLKLELKLIILKNKNLLYVTDVPTKKISNDKKKTINSLRGTTTSLIKQLLMDVSYTIYKKLNFVGVGYKVFPVDSFKVLKLLRFKLGFSHQIYFKIPNDFNFFCLKKQTQLYVYGFSYQNVSQIAAKIQSCKFPEPYKGKGILYSDEKITLKEGKKHK